MSDRILRWPDVRDRTGLSRTTIWRLINKRRFPDAVQLSDNAVGWRESEVAAWIESRGEKQAA